MASDENESIDLLTVEQFAKLTRRTPAAVRLSIARGDLPAHKLGTRRWFIRTRDIHRMFDEAQLRGGETG